MKGFDLDKILEILNILIKRGPSTPYEVYKESRLTLATAYRYVRKALDHGYIRENYGLIELTPKGLLLLALHDNKDAIYLLSKYLGFDENIIINMIDELRKRIDIPDLEGLRLRT
jgi:Sugar-specific transcriptional regulator TrmB.